MLRFLNNHRLDVSFLKHPAQQRAERTLDARVASRSGESTILRYLPKLSIL